MKAVALLVSLLVCVHWCTAGLGWDCTPRALRGNCEGGRKSADLSYEEEYGKDRGSWHRWGVGRTIGRDSGAAASSWMTRARPWGLTSPGSIVPHRRLVLRGGGEEQYDEDDDADMSYGAAMGGKEKSFTMGGDEQEEDAVPAAKIELEKQEKAKKEELRRKRLASWGKECVVRGEEGGGDIWLLGGRKDEVTFFGCKSTQRWNETTGEWDAMPTMNWERINCCAVQLGRKIYVAGGWHTTLSAMRCVEVLDLDNTTNIDAGQEGVWNLSVPMAKNRSAFGMAVLGGTIYACGGWDEEGKTRRSMEKWSPGMRRWEKCASMRSERNHFGFAAIGNRLVAAGGQDDANWMHNSVEVYEPSEDVWITLPFMMQHYRMAFPLVPFRGKLWAIGGYDCQGPPEIPEDLRDPLTGETFPDGWYARTNIPKEYNIPENATKEHDESILQNWDEPYVGRSVECLDPSTLEWTELTGALRHGRAESHGCVYNGTLVTFGGLNDDGGFRNEPFIYEMKEKNERFPHIKFPVFQDTTEVYDLASDTWGVCAQMQLDDPQGDFALVQVR